MDTPTSVLDLANLPTIDALDLLNDEARGSWVPGPANPALPYGPNSDAVRAIIERLPLVDGDGMARCYFVAAQMGAGASVGDLRRVFDGAALAATVERSGRRAEFLAAFWDAGRAGARHWTDPVFPQFFWNDKHSWTTTEAAQHAAAATVVADLADAAVLRPILAPWRAATSDVWPAGMLGPNQDRLLAFLGRVASLSIADARVIAAAWWPPEEDDPVWRTYDEPTARQVVLLGDAFKASRAADEALAGAVGDLVHRRLAHADIEPADVLERNTVLPKLRQATDAAALEIALGDHFDPETRLALRAGYAAAPDRHDEDNPST
jgi:hypothetical protein